MDFRRILKEEVVLVMEVSMKVQTRVSMELNLVTLLVVAIFQKSFVKYASFQDIMLIDARTCLIHLLFLKETIA